MNSIYRAVRSTPVNVVPTAFLLTVVACGGAAAPPAAPPPQAVTIEVVDTSTVAESYEFVGTVQPFRKVEVRSPISGIITARPFREGALVQKGDVLFEIDKTVYAAAARSAASRRDNAQRQVDRLTPLLADHAIAARDLDVARTELAAAIAAYDQAAKDLSDATVRAEITGRVGRALLELGARVTGSGDLLTTIDQVDPVYVSFRPSAQQQLAWNRSEQAAQLMRPGSNLDVEVTLPDGAALGRHGRLDYIDPVLAPGTGTREYRATFSNADQVLVPGQFVRVHLNGFTSAGAITIPQRAVQQQMGQRIVFVVGAGDTVAARSIEVGPWVGERWVIASGLKVGDRVIVDGFQKTGPGAVVAPSVAAADSATPTAAATGATTP